MPEPLSSRQRRRWLRTLLGVRALMVVVLLFCVGMGWIVHRARVQRETVVAIRKSGGQVDYDWRYHRAPGPSGTSVPVFIRNGRPNAPEWLLDTLGVDYFSTASRVRIFGINDQLLARVGNLDRLQELALNGRPSARPGRALVQWLTGTKATQDDQPLAKLTPMGLQQIGRLAHLQSLEIINVPLTDDDCAVIARLRELQQLITDAPDLSDAGMAHFEQLVQLRSLSIHSRRVTNAGLSRLRRMSGLSTLSLRGSEVSDLAPIRHLKAMEHLNLAGCPIDDAGLAPVAGYGTLQSLWLSNTKIGDAGIRHARGLSRLSSVKLDNTQISDTGLAELVGCPTLTSLDVSNTRITDAGLAELVDCTGLTSLDVSSTRITDAGLGVLAGAKALPISMNLDIHGTLVTTAGAAAAQKARPSWNIRR